MKLDGNKSPADAIREEINRLKQEQGFAEVDESSTADDITESVDSSDDDSSIDSFDTATYEQPTESKPPREQTVEYWKQRFDVLQGKYNAEIPRLQDNVNNLREQVEILTSQKQTSASNQSVKEILDDLEEQYGSDFTNAIDNRIQTQVKNSVKEQIGKFELDLTTIKQNQAVTEQQAFEDAVTSISSNWRSLNVDPSFISWVSNSTESFSGSTFQEILIDSYVKRDVSKVAKIFNTYEQLKSKSKQATQTKADDASTLIAPPKRGSSTNAIIENNNGSVFTVAQVNEFYRKLTAGEYRGKDAWVRTMKEEIGKANREGRIV